MKGNKNIISNKYTKIMLLALLIIVSILSLYLVTNTNNKVFNAKIINQKADTREVVNIPDQDLKNFLLTNLKKPQNERINYNNATNITTVLLTLRDNNYIKPSDENEIYKDEMEKLLELRANRINTKEKAMDLTGLEKAINLTSLFLEENKIENIEPLRGLTSLTTLYLASNKIENVEQLKGLTSLKTLYLNNNKIENIEPLKGLTSLTDLSLYSNKIKNIEPLRGLTNLTSLSLAVNKIKNLEPIKGLTNFIEFSLYSEEINISPNTNKFNLPVLKKYNGEILDIVQASNGLLKKNTDGTYSFTRKVTGVQIANVGTGIDYNDPKVDENWYSSFSLYILKIDPTNIVDEKVSITKK